MIYHCRVLYTGNGEFRCNFLAGDLSLPCGIVLSLYIGFIIKLPVVVKKQCDFLLTITLNLFTWSSLNSKSSHQCIRNAEETIRYYKQLNPCVGVDQVTLLGRDCLHNLLTV